METNQNQVPQPTMTTEQMLVEIYENTKKTKKYMQWILYITIVLVVLPLIVSLFTIPMALKSVQNVYDMGITQ